MPADTFMDEFWTDKINRDVDGIHKTYHKTVKVEYTDAIARVFVGDYFVISCDASPKAVAAVVSSIYSMLGFAQMEHVRWLRDQLIQSTK